MHTKLYTLFFVIGILLSTSAMGGDIKLYGCIKTNDNKTIPFAGIGIEGSTIGTSSNLEGKYEISLPKGEHILIVSAVGYKTYRNRITVNNTPMEHNIILDDAVTKLENVVIQASSSGISQVKRSAYNVVALDTKKYLNSTKNLSDIIAKAPGIKVRESGGVGSDIQIMLDGFGGKHVKIFIDGIPQEGVGKSFGLNNIPVNYADRIEIYRGVTPVQFATDAMGGIINIVTKKPHKGWNADISYSYGSFNTHKSFINFNRFFENGFMYEINAFQNYSDNNYEIYAPVEDFETGSIEKKKLHKVERFNDTYHNEAVVMKAGVTGKKWADRLIVGFAYSHMYKEIQTGVRQEIVYGEKHRKGYSIMPSIEYVKRNLFINGLNLSFTTNYNKNIATNIDTTQYKYNWYGETKKLNTAGEQSLQYLRAENNNWNTTLTLNYRLGNTHTHLFTLHYALNAFERKNKSLLVGGGEDPISKTSRKNIVGLSYRLMPSDKWNITAFGKYYNIHVGGPMAVTSNADDFTKEKRYIDSFGYGITGTYFIISGLQAKLSYEKAYRLPTIEEMFGDEDLEIGDIGIKPESSHNININLSYDKNIGKHNIYTEGAIIYRDTRDYIQRNIIDLSGGKAAATYINYGKVLTKGYNISLRYSYNDIFSFGGNITDMKILDNMKYAMGSSVSNPGYKEKMPNQPSFFADFDATFNLQNLFAKNNKLTATYDGHFVEKFSYYSSILGANKNDFMIPNQLSHNISITYSMNNGQYNISFECKNITNEKLYDNFSLQKAGRAFYCKIRIKLHN